MKLFMKSNVYVLSQMNILNLDRCSCQTCRFGVLLLESTVFDTREFVIDESATVEIESLYETREKNKLLNLNMFYPVFSRYCRTLQS